MKNNLVYQTDQLVRYFKKNRVTWKQFYESERVIIKQLHLDRHHTILDIGCGCGGLGLALAEQFGTEGYIGVESNTLAAAAGQVMNPRGQILCGDILDLSRDVLHEKRFDVVFSLGCVDWNIRFSDILATAWNHVLPGGYLVSTFRLTTEEGCSDFEKSYQYINYDKILEGERASYIVLNAKSLMQQLIDFNTSEINAYGYWGAPSATAVTPYDRLCFAAFSIRKRKTDNVDALRCYLNLPTEILDALGLQTQ